MGLDFSSARSCRGDFLIAQNATEGTASALRGLGVRSLITRAYTLSSMNFPEPPTIGSTIFSGIANNNGRIVTGPSVRAAPIPLGSSGEWYAVSIGDSGAKVTTDALGMAPIFHGRG